MRKSDFKFALVLLAALACIGLHAQAVAADPGRSLIPQLQERFGLSETQVSGALGALLIFVREHVTKAEFEKISSSIPNAEHIMQATYARGIVTGPLDNVHEYEDSLASLGIGQPLAEQIAPAVIEYLGAAGFKQERSILLRVVK